MLGADHDVAELTGAVGIARPIHREREHVGERVQAAVLSVEPADLLLVDQRQGQVPVAHPSGFQRRLRGGPQPLGVAPYDLNLDQAFLRPAARSPGACLSAYSL